MLGCRVQGVEFVDGQYQRHLPHAQAIQQLVGAG
jgi:hypothetical protein